MIAFIFPLAAILEIAGCYAIWAVMRLGASWWLAVPGIVALVAFAALLALAPTDTAGRAYAAYGGVYILGALLWLVVVEGKLPDRWDMIGVAICLAGAAVILYGPRGA